jgi:phosphoesterase RecJ-like protein
MLHEELGILLSTELTDPRLEDAMVTVTDVTVSEDLHNARVYVEHALPREASGRVLDALRHAEGFLRHALAENLSLRFVPELTFHIDTSTERARHIDILLDAVGRDSAGQPAMNQTPQNLAASLAEIAEVLRRGRRVLAFCHVSPDGDALGSLLALGWLLGGFRPDRSSETCQVSLVCADPVPPQLTFLPGADRITSSPPEGPWDAVVALDASDARRLGDPFRPSEFSPAPVIVLDHHITNLGFGTLNYVDTAAASTAQIVLDLAGALGAPISQEAAVCLLTGVVTDTLGFRTSNVTPQVLEAAVRLMEAGADLYTIADRGLGRRPLSVMRLWGLALSQLRFEDGVVWVEVTREMRAATCMANEDDGGLVSHIINACEARVAAVFGEMDDGTIDVDLRARPPYEVASAALSLGGGGHPQASGCRLPGPLADAQAKVLPLLLNVAHSTR